MIRAKREEFLQKLEAVQPGLAAREIIEQSSCFVFKDGEVITFNDEICCRQPLGLKIKGEAAVQAMPLLSILRKLSEEEIEIETSKAHFKVKGKRKLAGVRMESKVLLPIDLVDKPKKWKPLAEDFNEALVIVNECAGRDEDEFWTTCVHLHPDFMEATDNYQMSRFKIKTGFSESTLVRSSSIKHLTAFDFDCTEFSETDSWIHFRNPSGLVFSCRRFVEDYPDIGKYFKCKGSKISLPKGLAESVEKAEVFSAENPDNNQIFVELRRNKLGLKGKGVSGYYTEVKRLNYEGPEFSFLITPKLLVELAKRHNECLVTQDRIKVDGGKFAYVASLSTEAEAEAESQTEEEAHGGEEEV